LCGDPDRLRAAIRDPSTRPPADSEGGLSLSQPGPHQPEIGPHRHPTSGQRQGSSMCPQGFLVGRQWPETSANSGWEPKDSFFWGFRIVYDSGPAALINDP